MSTQQQASRFVGAKGGAAKDKSSGKTIITGDSGVGKTHLVSTIEAEDGRPIFLLAIEEGLKGASSLHTPATFVDAGGNPIVPTNFGELCDALVTFRDVTNIPQPPDTWFDQVPWPIGSAERTLLGTLVDNFPQFISPSVLSNQTGLAPTAVSAAIVTLEQARKVVGRNGSVRVQPDQSWKRPHLHFGVDSLSGIEKLIHQEVTGRAGVKSMADKEYNKLWTEAQPLWQQVQDLLDSIRRSTGAHIWIIAHCIEDVEAAPTSGEIYKARDLMLKGSGKTLIEIRQFWRQWADSIWYIMRDVDVQKGDKTRRTTARHLGRVLVTAETAQCRAKSRLPIPPRLPATWPDVRQALKTLAPAPAEKLAQRIQALLQQLDKELADQVLAEMNAAKQSTAAVPRLSALLSRVEGLILSKDEGTNGSDAGATEPAAEEPQKEAEQPANQPDTDNELPAESGI